MASLRQIHEQERAALCATFSSLGPAAPTLCEDWNAVSYLPLVERLSCPIQIHVGTADAQVVFAQTSQGTSGRGAAIISASDARELAAELEKAADAADAFRVSPRRLFLSPELGCAGGCR